MSEQHKPTNEVNAKLLESRQYVLGLEKFTFTDTGPETGLDQYNPAGFEKFRGASYADIPFQLEAEMEIDEGIIIKDVFFQFLKGLDARVLLHEETQYELTYSLQGSGIMVLDTRKTFQRSYPNKCSETTGSITELALIGLYSHAALQLLTLRLKKNGLLVTEINQIQETIPPIITRPGQKHSTKLLSLNEGMTVLGIKAEPK